jgi:NADH-quinone oxidoreductase subunit A
VAGLEGQSTQRGTAMDELLREYLPIIIFMGLAIVLGLAFLAAALVLAVRHPDAEKISAYECGFNAFDDARMKFDVRFYLVAILFIIFDLEIAFLFPWAAAFGSLSAVAFWSMMVFLAVLTVGFAYEWKKGALEWE